MSACSARTIAWGRQPGRRAPARGNVAPGWGPAGAPQAARLGAATRRAWAAAEAEPRRRPRAGCLLQEGVPSACVQERANPPNRTSAPARGRRPSGARAGQDQHPVLPRRGCHLPLHPHPAPVPARVHPRSPAARLGSEDGRSQVASGSARPPMPPPGVRRCDRPPARERSGRPPAWAARAPAVHPAPRLPPAPASPTCAAPDRAPGGKPQGCCRRARVRRRPRRRRTPCTHRRPRSRGRT